MTEETKEQQEKRLTAITEAITALVKEHGAMLVAGAVQAFALSSAEYMQAAMRVALLSRDVIRQKLAEQADTCQCEACRAGRAQA